MTIPIHPATRAAHDLAASHAAEIVTGDRAIVRRTGGKVTEEQYLDALERLASGETVRSVTSSLGLSRAAFQTRAFEDPEFERLFMTAVKMGAWSRIENAEDGLRKGEFSTGEVKRDIEYMRYAQWMASKLDRQLFGDRVAIDATVTTPLVIMPPTILPRIEEGEFDEIEGESDRDGDRNDTG